MWFSGNITIKKNNVFAWQIEKNAYFSAKNPIECIFCKMNQNIFYFAHQFFSNYAWMLLNLQFKKFIHIQIKILSIRPLITDTKPSTFDCSSGLLHFAEVSKAKPLILTTVLKFDLNLWPWHMIFILTLSLKQDNSDGYMSMVIWPWPLAYNLKLQSLPNQVQG